MRAFAALSAVLLSVASGVPALPAELTTAAELGPVRILLEPAEVLQAERTCRVIVPAGETSLTMPLAALGVAPEDALLEVADAEAGVRVATMEIAADSPQTARWRLTAEQAGPVALRLAYPIKGLTWAIEYAVTLEADGGLDVQARLTLTNGVGRPLEDAILVLPGGTEYRASLEAGETVTAGLMHLRAPAHALERSFLHDQEKLGDLPIEVLTIQPGGLQQPAGPLTSDTTEVVGPTAYQQALPGGKVRLFAPPEAGGDFIAETSIPYVPPHEPVELRIGPASGIPVTRTRTEAKEANKRQDAHNKTVLFDLDETYELQLRNLRRAAVELIIREHPQDTWQMLRASLAHFKTDAHTVEFRVHLGPGEERTINYQVRRLNLQP